MSLVSEEVLLSRIKRVEASTRSLIEDLRGQLDISEERIRTRVDGFGSRIKGFDGRVKASAIIGTIRQTQVEEGFALAKELTLLESLVSTETADIRSTLTEQRTTLSEETFALSRRVEHITARIDGVSGGSSATALLEARVTVNEGDISTSASDISTLQSDLTIAEGNIIANAGAVSALDTRVTSAEGTISSNSSSITTLSGTVGTNTASISTISSNIITVEGDITSIEQQWGVAFDVNGRVTGRIQLDGTGETTTFDVLASSFRFTDAATALTVFQIVGAKARFTSNVEIDGNLLISGTVTADVLNAATGTFSGSVDIGTGTSRTQITTAGITQGTIVIDGATNQNTIKVGNGYSQKFTITGGAAVAGWILEGPVNRVKCLESDGVLWFGTAVPGYDTNIFRKAASTLGSDSIFEAPFVTATNDAGEYATLGTGGGYGYVEVKGDTGAFLDLSSNTGSPDYEMRLITTPGVAEIQTLNNIDLRLLPHGTGLVRFGTKTATGDVAVDGYVTIKDAAGNTVKLATVA